jgi:hypothetical protein
VCFDVISLLYQRQTKSRSLLLQYEPPYNLTNKQVFPQFQLTSCACIGIRLNADTFSVQRSPNYDTLTIVAYIER